MIMRKYRSGDLIVYWYPGKCTHSTCCLRGLPKVFNALRRPWVDINAAEALEIVRVINTCPSLALRYSLPEGSRLDRELEKGPNWQREE